VTDHLTGIYNRQYLDQVLDAEVERVDRYHSKLSLVMMDLDDFKRVNDTYGHLVGDDVLVKSVETIHHLVRKTDTFGRWGGEEFILICPETDLHQASQLAEKVRAAIETTEFSQDIRLTFSLGVAQYHAGESVNECVDRADRNLYRAKRNGKNQVSASED
jgi:diguanylate cyclase (GGDEF)-like protein